MSGLQREVLKWIQSLDLTWQIKVPKWDLTNGYLIAEIFSWYFPQEIQMHSYNNGTSLDSKLKNWSLLKNHYYIFSPESDITIWKALIERAFQKLMSDSDVISFIKRHHLDIPEQLVEGTIHCKEGAASLLTERIYELLTNRRVKLVPGDLDIDFTDRQYQLKLPLHARSNATQAVRNNLRITEIMADQNLIASAQKAQNIINDHIEHRRIERKEFPKRFKVKPTVGEKCIRKPPNSQNITTDSDSKFMEEEQSGSQGEYTHQPYDELSREPSVQFKEIQVKQLDKSQLFNMPVQGY